MLKKIVALLFTALAIGSADACDGEDGYEAFAPWMPEGWSIVEVSEDDFDGDGFLDAVLLIEEVQSLHDENEGFFEAALPNAPRRIILLMGTEEGYREAGSVALPIGLAAEPRDEEIDERTDLGRHVRLLRVEIAVAVRTLLGDGAFALSARRQVAKSPVGAYALGA